jgi:hypothetical protein
MAPRPTTVETFDHSSSLRVRGEEAQNSSKLEVVPYACRASTKGTGTMRIEARGLEFRMHMSEDDRCFRCEHEEAQVPPCGLGDKTLDSELKEVINPAMSEGDT